MKLTRSLSVLLIAALVLTSVPAGSARASGAGQTGAQIIAAKDMLASMTPEQRVGQLFLVSFTGTKADKQSQIYDLIVNHYVGGVVLRSDNDNFVAAPDTVLSAYRLIATLQQIEADPTLGTPVPTASTPVPTAAASQPAAPFIPLFIGLSQDGDGAPNDTVLSGMTALPDPMAIGATWNTDLAQQVGVISGRELAALGVNLVFGPPLDVLDSPSGTLGNGLGADVFGGDPYWVGAMGQAYIQGLHAGSNARLAVIAKHFPGQGSSDRPEGEEPATVVKSLEQLKQIELAPFFAVTGNAQNAASVADGLLVSHIRYQGLQGNIRSTTRPVSFDPKALASILSLPQFATWWQNGGLMVSDDLGSPTVRKFYDTTGEAFQANQVALDAFLAGNDLLTLGDIQSSDTPVNYDTVLKILDFFSQKYRQDPVFAQRVDTAVLRILTVKYRLYGVFSIDTVVPSQEGLAQIGSDSTVTIDVARQSATLVSPSLADLDTVLPSPPGARDRLVFLTDTRPARQCSTCPAEPMLAMDALQNAVLRLYGTGTGGPIPSYHLSSYTFDDMAALLQGGNGSQQAESDLNQAQWVIINLLDAGPDQPQTTVLHDFLTQRQDLLRAKHVLVFSFNAPYYLDATDISKLTAYYCLYSKSAAFIDVAARLLFQELAPTGSLPVSVAGVGYDLLTNTSPDPSQVIDLSLDLPSVVSSTTPGAGTVEPTVTPSFKVGDTVSVRTGVILDYNQHPVPDGTPVRFYMSSSAQGGSTQEVDTVTAQGVARASFSIAHAGLLEVRAESNQALTSVALDLTVSAEGFSVTVISPTQAAEPSATPKSVSKPNTSPASPVTGTLGFGGWLGALLLTCAWAALAYWLGTRRSRRQGVRWGLCTLLGGLAGYNYLALHLPGAVSLIQGQGWLAILGAVLLGLALGAGAGVLWTRAGPSMEQRRDKTDKQKSN